MEYLDTLSKLHNKEITSLEAYELLYKNDTVPIEKLKKAHFVRVKMVLPKESPALNTILNTVFMFPIPLAICRFGLRFIKEHHLGNDLDKRSLNLLVSRAKKTRIHIHTEDAIIKISID